MVEVDLVCEWWLWLSIVDLCCAGVRFRGVCEFRAVFGGKG